MRKLVPITGLLALLFADPAAHAQAAQPANSCTWPRIEGSRITIEVEGDGPDVVLIPGLSSPRAVWGETAQRLKDRYRLHLVQVRGFGDDAGVNAQGPVLEPMMQEVADYIDDCITNAGRPAPAVVGHSLGGLTGLMIAARAPHEVGRLMVVDAVPFIGTIFAPGATAELMKPQAEAMAAAMRAQYDAPKPATPVADPGPASMAGTMSNTPAGRIAVAGWMHGADPRVSAQLFYDDLTTDLRGELGKIAAPVTLLYAQDDSVMAADAARQAFEPQYEGIAKFKAQMVTGSRHFIMLDQPAAFARALDAFLAE